MGSRGQHQEQERAGHRLDRGSIRNRRQSERG
jgi:hypothetical protein